MARNLTRNAELEIRRDLERQAMILDPEDPDYVGERFLRAIYRTSRVLLICRLLLKQGSSLTRAYAEAGDSNLFYVQAPVSSSSILSSLSVSIGGPIATLPHPAASDDEVAMLANAHFAAALRIGYDPADPCLRWMHPSCFRELCPEPRALLALDERIVTLGGSLGAIEGKAQTMQWLLDVFGHVSAAERQDWIGITVDYVRDFLSMSTDDERALMVSRLEAIAIAARDALDVRTELAATRLVASVLGLTFADEGRSQRELLQLLGAARTERSLAAAKSTYAASLPAPKEAS